MLSAVFGGLSLVLAIISLRFGKSLWDKIRARGGSAESDLEAAVRPEGPGAGTRPQRA